jgi:hypothetical protein
MLLKDFLKIIEYDLQDKKLYHAFFSGGVLESTDENTGVVDLSLRNKIIDLIPPIALLGTAIGNQLIQGKLSVGHMFPICSEYKKYLPENIQSNSRANTSVRQFTGDSFVTRRDDLRADKVDGEQAVQMKVDYEVFIPGTAFYHEIIISHANEVQLSCLMRMINLFKQYPHVGGRGSAGDGKLLLNYDLSELPQDELYIEFIKEKKDAITALIKELSK